MKKKIKLFIKYRIKNQKNINKSKILENQVKLEVKQKIKKFNSKKYFLILIK